MSCGIGRRRGLDPALLWLWQRLVATAPIRPLTWEPSYALGAALKKKKKGQNKKVVCNQCQVQMSAKGVREKEFIAVELE